MVDIVVNDVSTTTVVAASDGSVIVSTNEVTTVVSTPEVSTIVTTDTATDVVTVDSGLVIAEVALTTVIVDSGAVNLGGGGSGVTSYVRPTPMAITVGGAVPGTTFATTIEAALDTILYPYQVPTFSAFSFPQTSPLEVGDSVLAGSKTFSWTFTNGANVTSNTLKIDDLTTAITLVTGQPITSPLAVVSSGVTKTSSTNHTWRVYATDTQATVFNRDFTVNWYWRTCYGESALTSLASADILALRVTSLASTVNGTKTLLSGGYKWICYPTTFGLKTTFKDTATNLDVAMVAAATVPVTNSFGVVQNYYAHRTLNILGGAINIAVS